MKKIFIWTIILSFLIIASCTPRIHEDDSLQLLENEISTLTPEQVIQVKDALGRNTIFKSAPQRIVVVGIQTPMIVDFLYLFNKVNIKIAGIENRSQTVNNFLEVIDPDALNKMNLEKGAGAEQIVSLKPDLVIMKKTMRDKVGKSLEELDIPVFYLELESITQMYDEILSLGQLLDQDTRAQEILNLYREAEKEVTEKIGNISENQKPRVLLLWYNDRSEDISFEVPSAQWLQTNLVEMAGGVPVWKGAAKGGGWVTVNLEQIAAWNPEIIFIIKYSGGSEEIAGKLLITPIWKQLDAAKRGNIYGFPEDFISWDQPDTRWILALKWLAKKIHPALFESMNCLDEVRKFYTDFYGLDETVIKKSIYPMITGDIE